MMRRKNLFWGMGIVVCILLVVGAVKLFPKIYIPAKDYPAIQASGILNVVTEYNSVGYYVSGDTIAGFQYELCRHIEKRSGLEVRISLENNWKSCLEKLNNNTYDIIAMNIPITNESKGSLAFTNPITRGKQVLVQRKPGVNDSLPLIRNQIDLARKTILVPARSPCILRLHYLSEEIAEPIYIREVDKYTQEQILYVIAYGGANYAVVDKKIALKNAKLFPNLDMNTDISFTQLQAWAVRPNAPVLLDSLNRWMADY
ncbi:MAG: transporter substrate-binding domain-containing protein [Dysgonamonadaceae bacterium]|jgi:membrane-bound lytic murein transglycosylase MltF|nr:transporter substrate-binding domain-containing protein [Dysgonamonadaceae bacterium]